MDHNFLKIDKTVSIYLFCSVLLVYVSLYFFFVYLCFRCCFFWIFVCYFSSNQRIADYGHLPTLKLNITTLLPLFSFSLWDLSLVIFNQLRKNANNALVIKWSKVANFGNWWKSQFRALEKIQFVFQLK